MPRSVCQARLLLAIALGCLVCVSTTQIQAEEDFKRFLQGLLEDGRGELAAYYLDTIKDRPDLPEVMKTTWDLEKARALRVAAVETPNVDLQQKYVVEAQTHLNKFLKEHANHAEAASAQLTSGDISLFRAQNLLKTALRDKTKRDTLLPEARKLLDEARPKYEKSVTMFKARVDQARAETSKKKSTGLTKKAEAELAELVDSWLNSRFKIATVDYNQGLSYPEPKDPKRKDALTKAAKGFDAIYQENRGRRSGVYAHMWEGKSREEMEDFLTALEIYSEVMSAQPEKEDQRQAQWAAMFSEVNRYRLMLLGRTKAYEELISEASLWLRFHDKAKKSSGYQGIALELSKALLEFAKTGKPADFDRLERSMKERGLNTPQLGAAILQQQAKAIIAECAATPGEFQKDAILLKRLTAGKGEAAEIKSFDEAIALGDAAAKAAGEAAGTPDAKTNWTEADKAYSKAVELGADAKDANRVLHTRFALATSQFMIGKAVDAYHTAFKLAQENPSYAKAPASAALAVNIALFLYGQNRNTEALERINTITEFLLKTWPQHSEADEARIARGKLKLIQNDPKGGIDIFNTVNPVSDRYPAALQLAASTHWMMYLDGKKKADPAEEAETQGHRKQTVALLEKSLAEFRKVESSPQQAAAMQETKLLFAEVKLEGNQPTEAVTLLQPLLDTIKSRQLTSLDRTTLRVLVAAIRGFVSQEGKLSEAMEVGDLLVKSGDDIPPVNAVLIEFAKLVKTEWKRTAANLISAQQTMDENTLKNATLAEADSRNKISELLAKLGERKQYDLSGLVFLAESSKEIGLNEKAREQFEAIVNRANSDPAFAKLAAAALTRVRAQLIGLLREEKKFQEALPQVEALLKNQPNALEPLMEKGNLLQALAQTDPKRYDEAAKWWTGIRLKLQNMPKKPKEYYEVIYNCAYCLMQQKVPEKNTQAAQLLNGTLALAPNLDGPDRVEKYKAMLKQLPASQPATKSKTTAKSK